MSTEIHNGDSPRSGASLPVARRLDTWPEFRRSAPRWTGASPPSRPRMVTARRSEFEFVTPVNQLEEASHVRRWNPHISACVA
jgi:hypothetical protein